MLSKDKEETMDDMTATEIAVKEGKENELLKLLIVVKEAKSLEEVQKHIETKLNIK